MVDSSLKCNILSAKSAEWNRHGQVLSTAKHVAPGKTTQMLESTESAQLALSLRNYAAPSELGSYPLHFQGRRASLRSALCPWLLHSRAFGAQESNNSTTSPRCTSNLNSQMANDKWKMINGKSSEFVNSQRHLP